MATLAGVPAASASSTCVECGTGRGNLPPVFLKIVDKWQAETTGVFLKIETAFLKEFQKGATGGVFQKINLPPAFLKLIGLKTTGTPNNVFLKVK